MALWYKKSRPSAMKRKGDYGAYFVHLSAKRKKREPKPTL